MNKKEVFIQVFCAGLTGAAMSHRGKITDNHLAIAAEAAHKSVERLEKELEKYGEQLEKKLLEPQPETEAPQPRPRGRPRKTDQ